jgi:hypothetical protein
MTYQPRKLTTTLRRAEHGLEEVQIDSRTLADELHSLAILPMA